jgi:predicted acyltransferase (DUF342 family)
MKRYTLLAAFGMVLLLTGSVWAAGSKSTGNKTTILRAHGTIVSSTSSNLILSSKVKGKAEEETFMVNPETKIKGELKAGAMAEVHYKMDNGQKLATNVTVHTAMAAKGK